MATWRRSADSEVHVQIERAAVARCGLKTDKRWKRIDQAGQAICDECAFAVLKDASDAEDCLAQLKTDQIRAPEDALESSYKVAIGAVRALIRTVPEEPSTALLTEAERVLQIGDPTHALDLVRQWRGRMRDSGVLPTA